MQFSNLSESEAPIRAMPLLVTAAVGTIAVGLKEAAGVGPYIRWICSSWMNG